MTSPAWRERFMRGEAEVADLRSEIDSEYGPDSDMPPLLERLGISPAEFMVYANDKRLFERAMTWEREAR